jgi:uncharacterized membrane-anchored protein
VDNVYHYARVEHIAGYNEASTIVKFIIREYINQKLIVGRWNSACALIRSGLKPGVVITDEDIIEAYAIGAGGGCEFEFLEEIFPINELNTH